MAKRLRDPQYMMASASFYTELIDKVKLTVVSIVSISVKWQLVSQLVSQCASIWAKTTFKSFQPILTKTIKSILSILSNAGPYIFDVPCYTYICYARFTNNLR